MENFLLSSLLCAEDNDSVCYDNDEEISEKQRFNENDETEYSVFEVPLLSDECLCLLIQKECEQFVGFDYYQKLRNGDMDLVARRQAVDWIIKIAGVGTGEPLWPECNVRPKRTHLVKFEPLLLF
ncbi:cyclin, C-terminal domain-containing protein [Tanacetum coccineum]